MTFGLGYSMTRSPWLFFAFDHVRRLLSGDSDAVAGAMDELLAKPASLLTLLAARSIS